ncbi:MAG: hypothetical protein H8D87_14815 [Deltaproteobacteria bacterium]|uniref:polyhydroxyalkanoate synthesis regulator DNA-binding domain-containing protein n=1 Tax=Desulfobacula sp. TaxID=2593537 RepID=UPI001996F320|nr:hypothetical protein [Candidatus Desulfobacula maris]MBL6993314.1 hypothetical protein [Desulfobacula sp.]
MLNIKKYANGRFFDTVAKKYIKPEKLAEMIKKGEDIKVTLTQTGKDITETVVAQFSKKTEVEKEAKGKKQKKTEMPFLKTDKLKQWLSDVVDHKIEQVMDLIKLPTREQVAKLDENIKELNKKIDDLKLAQEKGTKKAAASEKTAAPKKEAAKNKTTTEAKPEENTPVAEKTAKTKTE